MSESFKRGNTYKFFYNLIWDITEDYRTNENKEYDIEKTIEKIIEDDNFWQMLNDYIWKVLVEKEGGKNE